MFLKSISLRAVRNYRRLDLALGPGLNLFFGDNAQGKTNLLEAAYFLSALRTFRGVKAGALVTWGEKEGAVRGEAAEDGGGGSGGPGPRSRRLQVSLLKEGRKVLLDGKGANARDYLLALKVAGFSPEDLFLAREYPSHRRRFLDRSVFHTYPGYIDTVSRAKGAVKQLNAALKAGEKKVIASYEEVLTPLAAEVTLRRIERVEALRGKAARLYDEILGGGGLDLTLRTAVKGGGREDLEKSYRALFEKKRPEGLKRGCCLAGPHTEDLVMTLSGRDIKASASRGQSRLALLSLVLADAELYSEARGERPVLLLDDVASELDGRRKDALLEYVSGRGQVLITSTDPGLLGGREGLRFKVEAGAEGARVCGSG